MLHDMFSQGEEMAKAIEQIKSLTVGHVGLGLRGNTSGSPHQQVHDGDTINVRALGNFDIRFLGIDAPEISFTLPGGGTFISLSNPRWENYLSDPFATDLGPFQPELTAGLRAYLQAHSDPGTATNHAELAVAAKNALAGEIIKDMETLGANNDNFKFFLAFAFEIMDRYGRLLCYLNRDQPDPNTPEPRPRSYNERLLSTARVMPYFIWPNVDPFRQHNSISDAVIPPGKANTLVSGNNALAQARKAVSLARQQQIGIFDATNPLRLAPFEVRFLARRSAPDRWVIDLGKNDDVLIQPQNYYTLTNVEDRLFIPEEYVPLFVEKGWRRQA
jgi:endonuclease YncB( thermonuclease family)